MSQLVPPNKSWPAYNQVIIQGTPSPGFVVVTGWVRKYGIDKKTGKGAVSSTLTYSEFPTAEGSLIFYGWTDDQFHAWDTYIEKFKVKSKQPSQNALSIQHPLLNDLDIKAILVKEIGQWEYAGGEKDPTFKKRVIKCEEFQPVLNKSSVSTPANATPNTAGTPPPPANNPKQDLIAKLSAVLADKTAASAALPPL